MSGSYTREKCIHSAGLSYATSNTTSITPVAVLVTLHQFPATSFTYERPLYGRAKSRSFPYQPRTIARINLRTRSAVSSFNLAIVGGDPKKIPPGIIFHFGVFEVDEDPTNLKETAG